MTVETDENWPVTWEDAERENLKAFSSLTPAQRLEWLEQALDFALTSGALEKTWRLRLKEGQHH